MKKFNLITPEGTRDLLFGECTARREVETKLMSLWGENGFSEVITPFLEFYDVFDSSERYFPQEIMYKLTDSKGRLVVIRPDSTLPIIRLAQTRLKKLPRPLRLCYNQTIYRANPKEAGRDDEIAQSGVEIIGGGCENDFEAISLAVRALKSVGAEWHFEIGDCRVFNALAEKEGIDAEKAEELRFLIENKNYPELAEKAPKSIAELPKLFGGAEVFGKIEQTEVLTELKDLYGRLRGERVTVDLGLTNTRGYYTGVLFNGYAEGFGKPILSGGRYRINGEDGIGFAVNVSAVAKIVDKGGFL